MSGLHSRSLIVAISPLYSEVFVSDLAQLRRAGFSVVVLRVDRPFESDVGLVEQRMARINAAWQQRRLAELGISVLPWNTQLPIEPVLRRAVSSNQRVTSQRGSLRNAGAPA